MAAEILSRILERLKAFVRRQSLFSRRRKSSIVTRMLTIMMLWGLTVYLFAIVGIWWSSTRVIADNFEKQAAEWVEKLDELGTPLYASNDSDPFSSVRDHVLRFPELAYLRFYDAKDNRVMAEYQAESLAAYKIPLLTPAQFDELRARADSQEPVFRETEIQDLSLLQASAAVIVRSLTTDRLMSLDLDKKPQETYNVIGYVELGLDFSAYQQQLVKNIAWGSLLILGLFFVTAVIGRVLIKKSLNSLIDLRGPLARLASGDTSVLVDDNNVADDEIRAIIKALNTTIKAIKVRDDKLQTLAHYDSLTGLINKHTFNQELQLEMARVRDENDSSALLFIDLDRFKHVNDTLGHVAGDRLLVQVAELLRNRMRHEDSIARFGGDEFTVIARSVNAREAESIAQSIVSAMQNFVFVEGDRSFNIYCSVGVVMIEPDSGNIDSLFSNADMACYQAKSTGRNCYHVFNLEEQEALRIQADISWSKQITDAIATNNLLLNFQPIVATRSDSDPIHEVLVRLRKDSGEIVLPNIFIPAAERLGLTPDIDYWVIENAFKTLAGLKGDKVHHLSINLSTRVFEASDLAEKVRALAKQYKIKPSQIIFEITEQTAFRHLEHAILVIRDLKQSGFQFALDDFGVGFSSFSYLKRLPVDYLKVDGSFVEDILKDPVDQAMMKAIVQVASTLGKKTIAEYVGDQETLELLRSLNVDYVQGYYLGAPVAGSEDGLSI